MKDFQELWDHGGWLIAETGSLLHCVRSLHDVEFLRRPSWDPRIVAQTRHTAVVECGRLLVLRAPTPQEKAKARRCPTCCRIIRYHNGYGTPREERERRTKKPTGGSDEV